MSENSEGVAVLRDFAFQNCSRPSINLEGKAGHVTAYDFNQGLDYFNLLASLASTGFQASQLGRAVHAVNEMLDWRLIDEPMDDETPDDIRDPEFRRTTKCKIFLSFTSNMVSCGVREIIRFLVQHKMVDVLCTTAGGIEEDLMKSMSPSFLADFSLPGASLHEKGLKRIGNLVVPNNSYTDFGRWLKPILDQLLIEQNKEGINWTPSKFISRLGKELNHQDSICYWAYTNNIPIYCPAITDGAIGDSLFFHSHSNPGLRMDIVEDIGRIAYEALSACPRKTGMIILGGGLAKHHVCNANLMRDGADFAVYINTAQEFDGSDSGAKPDEAKSWGKIKAAAKAVKVHCDASIAFPLLVAQTFAPRVLQSGIEQRNGFAVQNQVLSMANGCASAKQPTYLQSVELERP